MRLRRVASCCVGLALAGPASALNLDLPGKADLTREVDRAADTYFLPTAAVSDGRVPSQKLEGRVVRQAWRIDVEDLSTLGLLSAIRTQLQAQGYEVLLDCTADECGGFDFRFGIEVLPAPDMFVDLFDFQFLSAAHAHQPPSEFVTVLVSRAGQAGYVQLVLIGTDGATPVAQDSPVTVADPEPVAEPVTEPVSDPIVEPQPVAEQGNPSEPENIGEALIAKGHAILPDLVFATGSSALEDGAYASLADLAAFLKADPARRVALVGHTDAVGALDGNIRLSRSRAASVMARLMQTHGVAEKQLDAQGMGYLAPVATNATEEGRRANRRVEAVLLNTE